MITIPILINSWYSPKLNFLIPANYSLDPREVIAPVLFRELIHAFISGFWVISARMIRIAIHSSFFIQIQGIFLLKVLNEWAP